MYNEAKAIIVSYMLSGINLDAVIYLIAGMNENEFFLALCLDLLDEKVVLDVAAKIFDKNEFLKSMFEKKEYHDKFIQLTLALCDDYAEYYNRQNEINNRLSNKIGKFLYGMTDLFFS